jgi:hypothetical protein
MDKHTKDFLVFFQHTFLTALLWIALWGIVALGIDLLASGEKLTELFIYLVLLVVIVFVKIFSPDSI